MKRLLKWGALAALMLAIAGVAARFVLGHRSDDDGGGGWEPPPAPEPPSPSTIAEEYISPVDEPIAPPLAPAPASDGDELLREPLDTPSPSPEREPELVPSAEMAAEAGEILPDDVLAEDRDEGVLAPAKAVAFEHTELTSGHDLKPEPIFLDDALAEDRDDGIPAPAEAVAEPVGATDEVLAGDRDDGIPASAEAVEPDSRDFLTQAFERLAATPEVELELPEAPPVVEPRNSPPFGESFAPVPALADEEPWQPVDVATGIEQPAGAATVGDVSSQTWADLDELTVKQSDQFAARSEDGSGLESIEQALTDVAPERIQLAPSRNAESYLDEGNVYFNVGQYSLAIERYTRALELDSSLIAAYYNRANARTRSGEFDNALADYNEALALQPDDADALNNRGMLHLYRTNYAAALRDFDAALSADPSDTTVMVNRGLAHLHGGEPRAALGDFRAAITIDVEDAAAQYGAAQASVALGDRDAALSYVEHAIRLDSAYAREAAADPRLMLLQGDDRFLRMLRESGARSG